MSLKVLTLLLLASPMVIADDRKEICGDLTPNVDDPETEFDFGDAFKVHVEAVLPEMQRVANSWMEFSSKEKMLKTTLKSEGWDYALFHEYEHHQTLVYDLGDKGRGSCRVDPDMGERLGFYLVPERPAAGEIPSASDILRLTGESGFGESISLTKGKTIRFRSLGADPYTSCQKIKSSDGSEAILKVTHLISNTKLERTETGTVPLQVVFKGKFVSGKKNGNAIEHTYNFFHYTSQVGGGVFETPLGIVCPNRKGPNNFPTPPLYVRFGQEIHYSEKAEILTLQTTYDKEFNFVAEEFFDARPDKQAEFRFDDFNAGLTYNIDPNMKFCDAKNITNVTSVNDYVKAKDGTIQMTTPEQFWDKEGIEYHYNGKKHFRGLMTESWIGKDKTGGVYEWYFTFGVKQSVNDYAKSEETETHRVPYKRIWWFDESDRHYTTYYFQVDMTEPPLLLDLTYCFQNKNKFVSLYVEGLTLERVQKDETLVLRRAVSTLTNVLGVPFTRISRPQVLFRGGKGYIAFYLLDLPLYSSDVVSQYTNQPTLEEAFALLLDKCKKRELTFEVGNKDIFVKGEAVYEELKYHNPKGAGSGYSAGALAGLSIAMVVIGLAAGGGGGYWFFIKR